MTLVLGGAHDFSVIFLGVGGSCYIWYKAGMNGLKWLEAALTTSRSSSTTLSDWIDYVDMPLEQFYICTMIFSHTSPRNIALSQHWQDCIDSLCLIIKGCSRPSELGWLSEHNRLWSDGLVAEQASMLWARELEELTNGPGKSGVNIKWYTSSYLRTLSAT